MIRRLQITGVLFVLTGLIAANGWHLAIVQGYGWYLSPNVEWVPVGYPVDQANTLYTSPYALLNLRGGRQWGRWSVFVDLRNLADRRYIATTGVISDARGLNPAIFFPGDGRAVYAGVEFAW